MSKDKHHDDFGGLKRDLDVMAKLADRRQALRVLFGVSAATLLACSPSLSGSDGGSDGSSSGSDGGTSGTDASTPSSCSAVPQETGGPYPGDGTNGPNVLTQSGVVRSDIRSSFGSSSGTAQGIPLKIRIRLLNASGCGVVANAAIYLWHCDRDGNYSLYSAGITDQNYLRGVGITDSNGVIEIQSIVPGCYSGRWPHIHFEVFRDMASATAGSAAARTSQLALPEALCDEVYATAGYENSVRNLASITLASDNVFSDGASTQTPSYSGNATDGYTINIDVAVAL